MTYEEFCQKMKDSCLSCEEWEIKEENYCFFPKGYADPDDRLFIVDTNIKYYKEESSVLKDDFIVVSIPYGKSDAISRHCIRELYETYQKKGWEDVWNEVKKSFRYATLMVENGFLEHLHEYEVVRDHLIIRPLNFPDNRLELKDCVYEQIGDIALVLYAIIREDEETGLNTTKIRKGLMEAWGRPRQEVWYDALLNTNVKALPRLYLSPMDTMNPPFERGAFMSFDSDIKSLSAGNMPTITTTKQLNGAIAMFYPGVKEKLAELFGESFYLTFTSYHEARVHRKGSLPPRDILYMLKGVNSAFNPKEILSRKVWFYDKDTGSLDVVEL